MDDDAVLKGHMLACVRLRELGLQRARVVTQTFQSLINIARHDGRARLAEALELQQTSITQELEELAEARYQIRLRHYALCLMENDRTLTADSAISHAETLVLESVIAT